MLKVRAVVRVEKMFRMIPETSLCLCDLVLQNKKGPR